MASAKKATECIVCFETFMNPKLLPCRHSFCEKCIKELTSGSKVKCPVCKRICAVGKIVHDFQTEKFVQAFQEQECEFNRRLEAASAAMYPEPSAPPDEEFTTDFTKHDYTAPRKCELCHEKGIAFWCVECEQWICVSCKKIHQNTKYTKSHRMEKIKEKYKQNESALKNEIRNISSRITEFHTLIITMQSEKERTQDVRSKTLKEAKALRVQCLNQVNNDFDLIDQEIINSTDEQSSILDRESAKCQKTILELETKHKSFSAVVKTKDHNLAVDGVKYVKTAKETLIKTKTPDIYINSIGFNLHREQTWKAVALGITGGMMNQRVSYIIYKLQ